MKQNANKSQHHYTDIAKQNMIKSQLQPNGITHKELLAAFESLNREDFVMPEYAQAAYADYELPLPNDDVMLTPLLSARLLESLDLSFQDKMLIVGAGSGYVAALASKITSFVYCIELDDTNRKFAINNLAKANITNVNISAGDGLLGLASQAPFDKILINGGVHVIPDPLKQQLKPNGLLAAIVGEPTIMHAVLYKKYDASYQEEKLFETCVSYLNNHKLPLPHVNLI